MSAPSAVGPRRTPTRRALLAVPAAALCAVAGLSFNGAFEIGDIAVLCAVAAVLPAGAITALARFRSATGGLDVRVPDVVLATAVGWLVVVPLAAIWQEHAHGGGSTSPASFLTVLRTSLTDGASRLLTTAPPAPPTAVLLATVATLVWWASVWTTAAMLRGATPLAPLLPPAILLGLGTAASVAAGGPGAVGTAAAWVVVAVVYLALEQAVREHPADTVVSGGGGGSRWGAALAAAPTLGAVTACALVAVSTASHLPGLARRAPWDPRSVVSPPVVAADSTDPLTQAVAWLKEGTSTQLFTVDTSAPDQSLRWAVLDGYDGRHWSSSARYVPAGKSLPPGDAFDAPPGPSVEVRDSVSLDGMPGPFLAAPGRALRVSGTAVRVDPRLGLIATMDGRPAGTLGYTVEATVPRFDDVARLEAATPGSGRALDAFQSLPAGLPDDVTQLAGSVSAADPYDQLKALAAAVHDAFGYDRDAAAGQSYGRLNGLLAYGKDSATPSGASADAFATLFAVAARQSGFPSRVVVGFVPGQQISPHTYAVTGADVRVWPEVYFTGVGWVPFPDAVPGGAGTPSAGSAPVEAQPTAAPTSAADTSSASATSSGPQPGIELHNPRPGSSPLLVLLALIGVLFALAVLLFAGFALSAAVRHKRERAARRRDPDPRTRTQWAWLDGLDALGIGADSVLTPTELRATAPETAGEDGAEPLRKLARFAELAAYAAEPPASAEADEAWECAEQIRVLVRRRTPRRTRAARAFRSGATAVGVRARQGRRH